MRAPAGVPPSGNGKYIVLVVLLLGLVGGLVWWKKSQTPPDPIVEKTLFDAGPPTRPTGRNPDDDIPLPPAIEDAGPDSGPTKVIVQKFDNQCDAKSCSGQSNAELEGQLAFRVRQARRCYNAALTQDNTLKGKLSVRVRVGANGQVCAANVTSDEIGNAALANCVASTFRGANFPTPKGGCLDVNVPVNFVPGQ